jgi:catechol 2,3-dioxygenase
MATLPIDLDGVLASLAAGTPDDGLPAETIMGHVHLQVSEIAASAAFYGDLIGFDPTVTTYPGALFVSAGGYHHHLGLNVWGSRGAPPPPDGSRGLESLRIELPRGAQVDAIGARLDTAGIAATAGPGGLRTLDPAGNRVVFAER